ncbi:MAG: hypothetical protein RL693_1735, partial [Verrucomicrobiota bacterium]
TGGILLSVGLALTYGTILLPMMKAQEEGSAISLSYMGVVFAVIGVVLGLVYLVFGSRFVHLLHPAEGQSKIPVYVAGFFLAGIGLAIHIALKHYLESKGYIFH